MRKNIIDEYIRTLTLSFTFTHWATLTYRPQPISNSKSITDWIGTGPAKQRQRSMSVSVEKAKKDLTDYRAALIYLNRLSSAEDMTIKLFSAVEGQDNSNTHIHLLAYNWNGTTDQLRQTWRKGHSLIERIKPEDNKRLITYMMKDCSKHDTDHHIFKYLGRKWSDPTEQMV